jgi:hypothetical protein
VDSVTGYNFLQGFFVVTVVNTVGLYGAPGQLIITGFGVLA